MSVAPWMHSFLQTGHHTKKHDEGIWPADSKTYDPRNQCQVASSNSSVDDGGATRASSVGNFLNVEDCCYNLICAKNVLNYPDVSADGVCHDKKYDCEGEGGGQEVEVSGE